MPLQGRSGHEGSHGGRQRQEEEDLKSAGHFVDLFMVILDWRGCGLASGELGFCLVEERRMLLLLLPWIRSAYK